MSKFSPTPWVIRVDYALSDATGRDFCKMLWSDSKELEQVELDACLIQNAPELLTSLETLCTLCEDMTVFPEETNNARELIKKAYSYA